MEVISFDKKIYAEYKDLVPKKAAVIPYLREEKNGYFSMLTNNGDQNYTILNKTSKKIFDLCSGELSVEDMLKIIYKEYPDNEINKLKNDLIKTLGQLTRINAIEWKDAKGMSENPFVLSASHIMNEEIAFSMVGENEIQKLYDYFLKFFADKEGINNENREYYNYFWGQDFREFTNMTLIRQCLYSYYKDFFILTRKQEIIGVITVKPAQEPFLHSAVIQMISMPKEFFSEAIKEIFDYYANFLWKRINLVKLYAPGNFVKNNESFISTLEDNSFKLEGVSKGEYSENEDIHIYSYETHAN